MQAGKEFMSVKTFIRTKGFSFVQVVNTQMTFGHLSRHASHTTVNWSTASNFISGTVQISFAFNSSVIFSSRWLI